MKLIFFFQEEISEIIESVTPSSLINTESLKYSPNSKIKSFNSSTTPMTRDRSYGTNSLPSRKNLLRQVSYKKANNIAVRDDISDWSENILAEFNDIIAKEINELTRAKLNSRRNYPVKEEEIKYKDLLNEFGISDSGSSSNSLEELRNGIDKTRNERKHDRKSFRLKRNQTIQNNIHNDGSAIDCSNSDRLVIQKRRLSGSLPENLQDVEGRGGRYYREKLLNSNRSEVNQYSMDPMEHLLRNSSSLPTEFDLKNVDSHEPKNGKLPQQQESEFSKTSNGGPWSGFKMRYLENLNAKLPPRQRQDSRKKASQSSKGANYKRRKFNYERVTRTSELDSDYDDRHHSHDVGRSKSLENYAHRSAPVTPTEEKKLPFSRFLKKRHTPVFHDNGNEAILVRVSSLPDQDLLHLSNEQLSKSRKKEEGRDESLRKRDLSPLTLRSDLTAKRLSESNKDIGRISPVNLMKFPFRRSKSNDVAVECHFPDVEKREEIINGNRKEGKIEDESEKKIIDDDGSKSGSVCFI